MNTKEQLKAQREIAAIYQRGQQNACDKLDALRAAVDAAPHDSWCNFIISPSRYGLQSYQKHLNGEKDLKYACDCWKSRLPK